MTGNPPRNSPNHGADGRRASRPPGPGPAGLCQRVTQRRPEVGALLGIHLATVAGRLAWCVVVCAALGGLLAPAAVSGQEAVGGDVEVLVVARHVADGRVEFGLRQRLSGDSWGEIELPSRRFLRTSYVPRRWEQSSPVALSAPQVRGVEVRVVARRVAEGRVEIGLRQRPVGETWGEVGLPSWRFVPTSAPVGRWLRSSPLTIALGAPAGAAPVVSRDPAVDASARGFVSVAVSVVVAGEGSSSCGLRADGSVACWGDQYAGLAPEGSSSRR